MSVIAPPFAIGRAGVGEVVVDRTTGAITATPKAGTNFTLASGVAILPSGTAAAPSLQVGPNLNGLYYNATNNLGVTINGGAVALFSGTALNLASALSLGFGSTSSPDLVLNRDAADVLAQRRTTNAQNFRAYNTFTDASNHEYLRFGWASNVATISTVAAGTGTSRAMQVSANGITFSSASNAFDFKATAASGQPSLRFYRESAGVQVGAIAFSADAMFLAGDGSSAQVRIGSAGLTMQSGQLLALAGTESAPSIAINTASKGFFSSGTGIAITVNGTTKATFGSAASLRLASDYAIEWSSTTSGGGSQDLVLVRDAANVLAQRNSTTTQEDRVYDTFTDASNYRRSFVRWSSGDLFIGGESLGTGVAGMGHVYLESPSGKTIRFKTAGTGRWTVDAAGHYSPLVTNSYDVGTSKVVPRSIYFGTSLIPSEGANIVLGTTTGTKIGTATTQKLAFWNKTPITQLLKADYNNWAALSDLVNALVAVGLLDQA